MILNIVILLITNIIIPLLPIPELASPLPLIHFFIKQPTVYQHMNLTRIHTPQQFKKSFRQSLKILHPDRGGDQAAFSKVKNLKKIMEQEINYYDTLNITDVDLEYNIPFKNIVKVKQTSYFVQAGIYYFIALLFSLAYTIQDDMRPARKILLPLIFIFGAYEFYIHYNPGIITIIDLLHDKIPLFLQKTILKTILSTLIAIIRAKYSKKVTNQKKLLKQLNNKHTEVQYKAILEQLSQLYIEKQKKKELKQNSWGTRIRGWISKGFTLLMIFSIAKGFFGSGGQQGSQSHDL